MDRPIIGVLLGQRTLEKLVCKSGTPRLMALVRANGSVGANLFFFTILDIDLGRGIIRGQYQDGLGQWKSKIYKYPHAFYRRYNVPRYQQAVFDKFLGQLKSRGTLFLNYQFAFDKWEIHKLLAKNPSVNQHLPKTWMVSTLSMVTDKLDQYPCLYLKACGGGRGREVMRVEKIGSSYLYSYFRSKLNRGKATKSSLLDLIRRFFQNQKFIAQQAIDLLQVEGSNVDFRAEVQMAPNGDPRVGAIPVRIARVGSPITTHSASMSMERFIKEHQSLDLLKGNFQQRAAEFVITVFRALEDSFGYGAEVGVDFGVDRSGKFWLIECNAQSAKVSLFNSYTEEEVDQTFVDLLNYATGAFQAKRTEKGQTSIQED